jgi:hypothetical protein
MSAPTRPAWVQASDNRFAVECLIDRAGLPAPVLVGRPDAAYVTVTDVDDLSLWLQATGGHIRVSTEFCGVQTWVLHTTTQRPCSEPVQVRVMAVAAVDEPATHDVLEAVQR